MNVYDYNWFSPHSQERRIGSVIEVSPTEVRVNLTNAGKGSSASIYGTKLSSGEVNNYVFIDCGQYSVLGKIVNIRLENGERLSVDTVEESNIPNHPTGLIQILTSLDTHSGQPHKGIREYPRIGAQVYSAHPKLLAMLFEGTLNTSNDDILLEIGEVVSDASATIYTTPEKLFGRHCAILGSTGCGKSYTLANLILNVQEHGGKVLLLDATGEYADLPCDSYSIGDLDSSDKEKNLFFPSWEFTESDIRLLLRPSQQVQAVKLQEAVRSLQFYEDIHKDNKQDDGKYNLYFEKDSYKIVKKEDKVKEAYEEWLKENFNNFDTLPWDFNALANQITEECVYPTPYIKKDANGKNIDLTKNWGGKNETELSHCLSLIGRVRKIINNPRLKWFTTFGIDHNSETTNTVTNKIKEFIKEDRPNCIMRIDLSKVSFEENTREILVNAIGKNLLSLARNNEISHTRPLIVFVDEAHQFLNKHIGDDFNKVLLDSFGNIAKEGRKYGLNIVIATQRPSDIPEDVLSQLGTYIVHRLTNARDQEIVKRAMGELDRRSASFLPTLGVGEALLLGTDFLFPVTVKMKIPKIKPNSTGSLYSKVWRKSNKTS
ncbi:hypothetical protein CJP74_07700 [Psittacicella melopsittaci]|uniref:AAA+ ATPase domain-containing protein n=2 Tax=Psittacicella melopsittaci TaxID=2028576 RepID=A0A3A1Y225_9GAMM|nr:hypothetical protein CJP74_07700 [Psittacicella melopsittaci]